MLLIGGAYLQVGNMPQIEKIENFQSFVERDSSERRMVMVGAEVVPKGHVMAELSECLRRAFQGLSDGPGATSKLPLSTPTPSTH